MNYSPAVIPCISKNKSYCFWSHILPPLFLVKCVSFQALIWTLYVFNIQMNLQFQNTKYLFCLKSSENVFGQGIHLFFTFLKLYSKLLFAKFDPYFIPSYIAIIFYSFFLAWITIRPWHIAMRVFEIVFC